MTKQKTIYTLHCRFALVMKRCANMLQLNVRIMDGFKEHRNDGVQCFCSNLNLDLASPWYKSFFSGRHHHTSLSLISHFHRKQASSLCLYQRAWIQIDRKTDKKRRKKEETRELLGLGSKLNLSVLFIVVQVIVQRTE